MKFEILKKMIFYKHRKKQCIENILNKKRKKEQKLCVLVAAIETLSGAPG